MGAARMVRIARQWCVWYAGCLTTSPAQQNSSSFTAVATPPRLICTHSRQVSSTVWRPATRTPAHALAAPAHALPAQPLQRPTAPPTAPLKTCRARAVHAGGRGRQRVRPEVWEGERREEGESRVRCVLAWMRMSPPSLATVAYTCACVGNQVVSLTPAGTKEGRTARGSGASKGSGR